MLDHDLCLKHDKQHNIDFPHRDDDRGDREVNQLIEPLEIARTKYFNSFLSFFEYFCANIIKISLHHIQITIKVIILH